MQGKYNKPVARVCDWCKNPFPALVPNQRYCCVRHRMNAQNEKERKTYAQNLGVQLDEKKKHHDYYVRNTSHVKARVKAWKKANPKKVAKYKKIYEERHPTAAHDYYIRKKAEREQAKVLLPI